MTQKIQNLINLTKKVSGWLSVQEGIFLFKLASRLGENDKIIEIGSWHGKSTIWLASAIQDKKNTNVYAIDPHIGSPEKTREFRKVNTYDIFIKNIQKAGVAEKIIPIRKPSLEVAEKFQEKAAIVFIDGSHKFLDVKADFLNWKTRLEKGSWMILHDATVLPGPWKVAKKYLLNSTDFYKTGMLGSMVFGQYCPQQGRWKKILIVFRNFLSYLFIISYVNMRKIPLAPLFKKQISKSYFKRKIAEI